MNLKHYYYRTYFSDIDLQQPVDEEARKALEKKNEPKLKEHNQRLTNAVPKLMAGQNAAAGYALPPGNTPPLLLKVKNPGMVPGLGYPHEVGYAGEFKLGLSFDHTTGLPALPGSSVKGALRAVWPQYGFSETKPEQWKPEKKKEAALLQAKKGRFILKLLEKSGFEHALKTDPDIQSFIHRLELSLFEGWHWDGSVPRLLPMSKRAVYFDAFPVEAATINGQPRLLGRDAITPHGSNPLKNPTPLPFIKVLPGVMMAFSFRLPTTIKVDGYDISRDQLLDLFSLLLEKTGIGAKTNVGYGRLEKV